MVVLSLKLYLALVMYERPPVITFNASLKIWAYSLLRVASLWLHINGIDMWKFRGCEMRAHLLIRGPYSARNLLEDVSTTFVYYSLLRWCLIAYCEQSLFIPSLSPYPHK